MSKIRYKAAATMLAAADTNRPGELTRKTVLATAEVPYTAENLDMVKRIAVDGKYEIIKESESAPDEAVASQDRIRIVEQGTGKNYVLYVENGKLMMEVE